MTAPRPSVHASAGSTAGKFPRDAWLLAALEREHLVAASAGQEIRRQAPEWSATMVIHRGWAAADVVVKTAARAAHVQAANLDQVDATALHFIQEGLARQYAALPLSATNRVIRIATADPLNLDAEQALGFASGRQVEFFYALPEQLLERLNEVYRPERPIERLVSGLGHERVVDAEEAKAPPLASAVEAPAARLVDATISDAVRERANDVLFEPTEEGLVIRYRIDGVQKEVMKVPKAAAGSVARRLKVIANLDIADPLHPHDGRASAKVDGKPWDLRVSTTPAGRLGESVLVRLHDPMHSTRSVGELGLWADERALLEGLLQNRDGAILIVGPADSGTTTTAYAAFQRAHTRAGNVATVEEPIEFRLQGVNQVEVSEKSGFSFAEGLRSALRQNPEVILVGEVHDPETAEASWQAARSGRLVITVVRARDAVSTIARLGEIGLDVRVVAASLRGIVAQRLVRLLCTNCAVPTDVESLPPPLRPPGSFDRPVAIKAAKGCPQCGFTGYRGRVAIQETLTVDASIAGMIAANASADNLVRAGRRYGMRSLWQAGLRRVWAGETSHDELVRVVGEPDLAVEVPIRASGATPLPPPPVAAPAPPRPRAPSRPVVPPPRDSRPAPAVDAEVPPLEAEVPPPAPPVEAAPAAAPEAAPPGNPPLILIADDDPAMRVLVITIMKAQGFEVAEAVDGLDALEQAQRLAPAVLLLDMDMPRLDGFGVLEALRRRLAGRAVPVVVVTAHDDPATEARCIELGAEDYLTKPIQPSSLVVRVRAVLRRVGAQYAWPRS